MDAGGAVLAVDGENENDGGTAPVAAAEMRMTVNAAPLAIAEGDDGRDPVPLVEEGNVYDGVPLAVDEDGNDGGPVPVLIMGYDNEGGPVQLGVGGEFDERVVVPHEFGEDRNDGDAAPVA